MTRRAFALDGDIAGSYGDLQYRQQKAAPETRLTPEAGQGLVRRVEQAILSYRALRKMVAWQVLDHNPTHVEMGQEEFLQFHLLLTAARHFDLSLPSGTRWTSDGYTFLGLVVARTNHVNHLRVYRG